MKARKSWSSRAEAHAAGLDDGIVGRGTDPLAGLLDTKFNAAGDLVKESSDPPPAAPVETSDLHRAVEMLARRVDDVKSRSRATDPEIDPAIEEKASAARNRTMEMLDQLEARLNTLSRKREEAKAGKVPEQEEVSTVSARGAGLDADFGEEKSEEVKAADPTSPRDIFGTPDQEISTRSPDWGPSTPESNTNVSQGLSGVPSSDESVELDPVEIKEYLADISRRIDGIARSETIASGRIVAIQRQFADMQDSLSGGSVSGLELSDQIAPIRKNLEARLDEIAELVGRSEGASAMSAVETGYNHILERIAKIESIAQRAVPPDDLWSNIESIRKSLSAMPSANGLEGRLKHLSDRLDELAQSGVRADQYDRFHHQLTDLSTAVAGIRETSMGQSGGMDERLIAIFMRIEELLSEDREVDLGPIEASLGEIARRLEDDLKSSHFGRIEHRLAALTSAVESVGAGEAVEEFQALRQSLDMLHQRVAGMADSSAQSQGDAALVRAKLEEIGEKLDTAESLTRDDLVPIATRMGQLERTMREDLTPPDNAFIALHEKLDTMRGELDAPARALAEFGNSLEAIYSEVTAPDAALADMSGKIDALRDDMSVPGLALAEMHDKLDALGGEIGAPGQAFADMHERIDALRAELNAPEQALTNLNDKLDVIYGEIAAPNPAMDAMSGKLDTIRSELAKPEQAFAELHGKLDAMQDGAAKPEAAFAEIHNRLDGISHKLADLDREEADRAKEALDQIALLQSNSSDPLTAGDLEGLRDVLRRIEDSAFLEDVGELRSDIAHLRRELRSMPSEGGADADEAIVTVLREVTERLDKMPTGDSITFRDLEDQIGRIVRAIENPEKEDDDTLAQVESRLLEIQKSIDEKSPADFATPLSGKSDTGEELSIEMISKLFAEITESLSEDLKILKDAAAATEENTRRALEAVHETLETVIARLGDLEGHNPADAPMSGLPMADASFPSESVATAPLAVGGAKPEPEFRIEPEAAAGEDEPAAPDASPESLALTDVRIPAMIAEDAKPTDGGQNNELDESSVSAADEANAVEEPAKAELSIDEEILKLDSTIESAGETPESASEESVNTDESQHGLLGRLTPGQLLKRATGGKAESFTPPSDDAESAGSNQPLEPGTDAPLSSSLADAPSSGTYSLSGELTKEPEEESTDETDGSAEEDSSDMPASKDRQPQDEIDVETDFLVAARRAAQAAAQEVMEAEHRAGIGDATHGRNSLLGILGAKRRFILICLLIIAVMVAGIQAIKNGIIPGLGQRPVTATDFSFVSPESDSATTVPSNVVTSSTKSITDDRRLEFAEPTTLESPGFTASTNHLMSVPAIEPIVEQSEEFAALDAAQIPLDPLPKADQYELAPETEPAPELVALPEMEATVTAALPEADDGLIYPLPPEGIGPERLRVEAAKGNPIAMFDIASRYADGRGALQDIAAAAHWYGLAADAGLAPAQYRLGSIYENGIGLRKDIRAAEAWYRRAAVAGNINAMHNLAVLYAEGAGGNPDLSAAAGWFRRAAELGVRDSQFNLAILHARGLGVPEDYMEAYKWFAIAARFGDLQAEERRDQIASALTDSQRNAAMAEAQDFVPSASNIEANTVELPQDKWRDAKPDFAGLSENEMIRRAQTLLNTAGYDVGRPDGIYGPLTRKAIVGFQKKMGLPESGQVDKQLLAALEAHSS